MERAVMDDCTWVTCKKVCKAGMLTMWSEDDEDDEDVNAAVASCRLTKARRCNEDSVVDHDVSWGVLTAVAAAASVGSCGEGRRSQ